MLPLCSFRFCPCTRHDLYPPSTPASLPLGPSTDNPSAAHDTQRERAQADRRERERDRTLYTPRGCPWRTGTLALGPTPHSSGLNRSHSIWAPNGWNPLFAAPGRKPDAIVEVRQCGFQIFRYPPRPPVHHACCVHLAIGVALARLYEPALVRTR